MKKTFESLRTMIINFKSFKHISNEDFTESLIGCLSNQLYVNNNGFNRFCKISIDTLNGFALITGYLRYKTITSQNLRHG